MRGFGCTTSRDFFNSFGRLLKGRRRTKKHCVLRLGLIFSVAVSPEKQKTLSNEMREISDLNALRYVMNDSYGS